MRPSPPPQIRSISDTCEFDINAGYPSSVPNAARLILKKATAPEFQFILSNGVTLVLGTIFAVFFSIDLGPKYRGILTLIFLTSFVFSSLPVSGLNLTYKSGRGRVTPETYSEVFFLLSIVLSLSSSLLTFFTMYLYGKLVIPLNNSLLVIAVLYTFFSCIYTQVSQFLLSRNLLARKWKTDLIIVVTQVVVYSYMITSIQLQTIYTVLISLSIGFIIGIVSNLPPMIPIIRLINLFKSKKRYFFQMLEFMAESKSISRYSFLVALSDRIDKILVSLFYPPAILGSYSFVSGFVSVLRFIPDSVANLSLTGNLKSFRLFSSRLNVLFLITLFTTFTLITLALPRVIENSLGREWVVPIFAVICCGWIELLRGYYINWSVRFVSISQNNVSEKSILCMLVTAITFFYPLHLVFGVSGIPLSVVLGYLAGLTFLKFKS